MPELIFRIEEHHAKDARKWIDEHPCEIRGKRQGAIGGAITYTFTNTTIGQIQSVECGCGEELCLTDDL